MYLYFYEEEITLAIKVGAEMRFSFAIIQNRKAHYPSNPDQLFPQT